MGFCGNLKELLHVNLRRLRGKKLCQLALQCKIGLIIELTGLGLLFHFLVLCFGEVEFDLILLRFDLRLIGSVLIVLIVLIALIALIVLIVWLSFVWKGVVLRTVSILLFEVSFVVSVLGTVVVVLRIVGLVGVDQISASLPVIIGIDSLA
jgi:hypothetical protein